MTARAHSKRQRIAVIRDVATARREPVGGLPPEPHGHVGSYRLDGVFFCGCGRPVTSHAALVAHHDGVRVENAARGAAGLRLAASALTYRDAADAYDDERREAAIGGGGQS